MKLLCNVGKPLSKQESAIKLWCDLLKWDAWEGDTLLKLNISAIKDFLKCETYAHYLHDELRAPRRDPADALVIGGGWHKLMEHFIIHKDIAKVREILHTEIAPLLSPNQRERVLKSLTKLIDGLQTWNMPPDWEVYATEHPLEVNLPGCQLIGTLDALIKWNGYWWHVQHKTLAETVPLQTYWDYMVRDWHESVYQYLAQQHGFEPYGGTILVVAVKTRADRPTRIVHSYLLRPQHVVDKAVHDVVQIAAVWELARKDNNFIQNRDSCINAYRNSLCPYYGVCHGNVSLSDDNSFQTIPSRYPS